MRELKFRVWDKWRNKYTDALVSSIINNNGFKSETSAFIIEQYTNLNDSFSTEIYEGDICEIDGGADKPAICWVIFADGCFCIDWHENDATPELKYYVGMEFCTIKIVGNIHENMEMIK